MSSCGFGIKTSVIMILIGVIISLLTGFAYHTFNDWTRALPAPSLDINKYWGPGAASKYKADKAITPFMIKRSSEELADLRSQLNRTSKFTEPLEGIHFEYGYNTKALLEVVKYWRDNYLPRWAEREAYLNKFPQYTTEIQGLRIHYIHVKPSAEVSKKKKVIPLLLLHGWPGSVREFYDLISLLTEPSEIGQYAFEVIVPSLVGYGWSQGAAKPGFNPAQMAVVMRNLMLRVGHEQFLIQGGDWGSFVGNYIATLFPENVIGYHSNLCLLYTPLSIMKGIIVRWYPHIFIPAEGLSVSYSLLGKDLLLLQETGYSHLQATKPDTIGAALIDNPIGLAAYILEKFQSTTGPDINQKFQSLTVVYDMDALLDNLMIYQLSNSATTAARLYAEGFSREFFALQMDRVQSSVPMGCARFKNDIAGVTDWQLKDKFPNLIHSKYYNKGGHFAALEVPDLLYTDFTEFVRQINLQ